MLRAAALTVAVVLLAGCGGSDESTATAPRTQTAAAAAAAPRGPVPPAVSTVESAAEDTIDFALAGRRAKGVGPGRRPQPAPARAPGAALRRAGVSSAQVADFRRRATEVARLAPHAALL